MQAWTFLTDHTHLLVLLARGPRTDVVALAREARLDPRVVASILQDLESAGYIRRTVRDGVVHTTIDRTRPLRHPVESHHAIGELLDAVESPADVLRARIAARD